MNIRSPFRAEGRYELPAKRIVVIQGAVEATVHHYLTPRLQHSTLPVATWDIRSEEPPPSLEAAYVIVVRYLDRRSLRHLRAAASRLAGVVWLVDDDMPGAARETSLPLFYRWRLAKFWVRYRAAIGRLASEIWFASDDLLETYAQGREDRIFKRIDPVDGHPGLAATRHPRRPGGPVVIFYHGQITHLQECLWLRDVIRKVQARVPNSIAEIVGRRQVRQAFLDIPRCRVLHPMSWTSYRTYVDTARGDIGLAPLLDTAFNRSRSYVKYLEIVRHGGVGVFADRPPYAGVVRHGENGLLLPTDKDRWVEGIVGLATDDAAREAMREQAMKPPAAKTPRSLSDLLEG